jgi:death-on-curing protein
MTEIQFLNMEEVMEFHHDAIRDFGGQDGIRDVSLLQSALAMPQAGIGDTYLHADIYEMASAYLFHIVQNHPFLDGNKRTGTIAALSFLAINGIFLEIKQDHLEQMVLNVANGKSKKSEIAKFFRNQPICAPKNTLQSQPNNHDVITASRNYHKQSGR